MALLPWRKKKQDLYQSSLPQVGPPDPTTLPTGLGSNDPLGAPGGSPASPNTLPDPIRSDQHPLPPQPDPLPEHGPNNTPPATGILPTGNTFPGSASPPPITSNPDTPPDPVKIHVNHSGPVDSIPTPNEPVVSLNGPENGDTPSDPSRITGLAATGSATQPDNVANLNQHHDAHWWATHYPHTTHDPEVGPRPRDDFASSLTSSAPNDKPAGVNLGGESINVGGATDPMSAKKDDFKPWSGNEVPGDAMGLNPHPEDKS